MHRKFSIKLTEFNSQLTCYLCKGYLIDAVTITECLHSFCKTCIVRYIRKKESCPVCKLEIMKEKIQSFLKKDGNLQYIVYKLVPGLFKAEMERRQIFFTTHPKALNVKNRRKIELLDKEALGDLNEEHYFKQIAKHENLSISIEYNETGLAEICESQRQKELDTPSEKIYLECPPELPIRLLKIFLKTKFSPNSETNYDIMYDDKPLNEDLALMDIAYIYAWRAKIAPMRLFYRVAKDYAIKTEQEEEDKTEQAIIEDRNSPVDVELTKDDDIKMDSVKMEKCDEQQQQIIMKPVMEDELKNNEKENHVKSIEMTNKMDCDEPKPVGTQSIEARIENIEQFIKYPVCDPRQNLQPKNININDGQQQLAVKKPRTKKAATSSTPRKYTKKLHENVNQTPSNMPGLVTNIKTEKIFHPQPHQDLQQHHQQPVMPQPTYFNYNPQSYPQPPSFQHPAFPTAPLVNQFLYAQQLQLAAEKMKQQQQQPQALNLNKQQQEYVQSIYQNFAQNFLQNHLKPPTTLQQQPLSQPVPPQYERNCYSRGSCVNVPGVSQYNADIMQMQRPATAVHFNDYRGNDNNARHNDATSSLSLKETQMKILESCNLVND